MDAPLLGKEPQVQGWETWEVGLVVAAGLIAMRSLAGMMRRRNDLLVGEVQKQLDAYREKIEAQRRAQQAEQQADQSQPTEEAA